MKAMVLNKLGKRLEWTDFADRQPGPGEIRVKVSACGVCRTDLHVVDGELPNPQVPIIPGHEIVGRIDVIGAGARQFSCPEGAKREAQTIFSKIKSSACSFLTRSLKARCVSLFLKSRDLRLEQTNDRSTTVSALPPKVS